MRIQKPPEAVADAFDKEVHAGATLCHNSRFVADEE